MEANNFSQSNVLEFASKPSQTVWSVGYNIMAVFCIKREQFVVDGKRSVVSIFFLSMIIDRVQEEVSLF